MFASASWTKTFPEKKREAYWFQIITQALAAKSSRARRIKKAVCNFSF